MDSVNPSVGIDLCLGGTAKAISTLPMDINWNAYLHFSEDEADLASFAILEDKNKLQSLKQLTPDPEDQDSATDKIQVKQLAKGFMSLNSRFVLQSTSDVVTDGDHGLNDMTQHVNKSSTPPTLDAFSVLNIINVEDCYDLDGLAGMFGFTLEQVKQGIRNCMGNSLKRNVESVRAPTLCQPAGVQKPKLTKTKPAVTRRLTSCVDRSPSKQFLRAGLEENQRLSLNNIESNRPAGGRYHPLTPITTPQALQQGLRHQAQLDGQLAMQHRAQHQVQQCRNLQLTQYQTQSLLATQQAFQHQLQFTNQMGLGYEAAMCNPQLIQAQQQYGQYRSNGQTHARLHIQQMMHFNHQQGCVPIKHEVSSPMKQWAQLPLQQNTSSDLLRQVQYLPRPLVPYSMPQHAMNGSSKMRAPGQQRSSLDHQVHVLASPQYAAHNINHPQRQTQPLPDFMVGMAQYEMEHRAQTSRLHLRYLTGGCALSMRKIDHSLFAGDI